MDKTFRTAIIILVILNLIWAGMFISRSLSAPRAVRQAEVLALEPTGKYTLYVGLNDKDAQARLVGIEDARKRLNAVAAKHVNGFTVYTAQGFWRNEKGMPKSEDTLVYDFVGATEEQVIALTREMLLVMNQGAVLLEKSDTRRMLFTAETGLK